MMKERVANWNDFDVSWSPRWDFVSIAGTAVLAIAAIIYLAKRSP